MVRIDRLSSRDLNPIFFEETLDSIHQDPITKTEPITEAPLLREWKYTTSNSPNTRSNCKDVPRGEDVTDTTPIAVPVNIVCSLPTRAAFVATCVTTQLRKLSDTWLNQPPDAWLSQQQQQQQQETETESSNETMKESQENNFNESGTSSVEAVLQDNEQIVVMAEEEQDNDDDWEIVEEEEILLVYGEVVMNTPDEDSDPSSKEQASMKKTTKKKKGSFGGRRNCTFSIREWMYKQRVRFCKNCKKRCNRRRNNRRRNQKEATDVATSTDTNTLNEAMLRANGEIIPHYNLALTDRSIDNHLESIRRKIEEDEATMNLVNSTRSAPAASCFRREKSCENLYCGDIEMNEVTTCSFVNNDKEHEREENTQTMESLPTDFIPNHRAVTMKLPSVSDKPSLYMQGASAYQESAITFGDSNASLLYDSCSTYKGQQDDASTTTASTKSSKSENTKVSKRVVSFSSSSTEDPELSEHDDIVVNDTLKIMFVGTPSSNKSDLAKRFVGRRTNPPPKLLSNSRMGIHVYPWNPRELNTEIKTLPKDDWDLDDDVNVNVKFKVWDFLSSEKNQAAQELFFSPQALYVLVWDMGLHNPDTYASKPNVNAYSNNDEDSLSSDDFDDYYDDSDNEDFEQFYDEGESRTALHQEIDENVQFWINCIQRNAPGSIILPIGNIRGDVAGGFDQDEIRKRYKIMKERLLHNEDQRIQKMIRQLSEDTSFVSFQQERRDEFLRSFCVQQPKLIFSDIDQEVVHTNSGLQKLQERIVHIATGRDLCGSKHGLLSNHIGTQISPICARMKDIVKELRREKQYFMDWNSFYGHLKARGLYDINDINDALHFLASVGEIVSLNPNKKVTDVTDIVPYVDQFQTSDASVETSNFVLLNPNLIVDAISVILKNYSKYSKSSSNIIDNVPRISQNDLYSIWASQPRLYKSIVSSSRSRSSPFKFLEKILTQYNMLIPIASPSSEDQSYFLIPSLLESVEPSDTLFTYKPNTASTMTLCHSWLFPEQGMPIGFMENLMGALYSAIYSHKRHQNWKVEEIMFWKKAIFINCGNVKLLIRLTDQSSPYCVASNHMSPGMKRLTVSGQGSSLFEGKYIWEEGFGFILNTVQRVMKEFNSLDCEEQILCPKCLKHHPISEAHVWSRDSVYDKVTNSESRLICQKAHVLNGSYLTGISRIQERKHSCLNDNCNSVVRFEDLLGGVVLIGVYDSISKRFVYAGSGFIVDKSRGLIVTAAHTIFESDKYNFGKQKGDKIYVGVIPRNHKKNGFHPAVFRYVANIVTKDSSIDEKGICKVDSCVLKIFAKNRWDVSDYEEIPYVPQDLMTNKDIKDENLQELKVRDSCEIEERVRVIGFSQSGQNLLEEGAWLFRNVGCTPGVVVARDEYDFKTEEYGTFCPTKEIRVACDTNVGESGGPCINQQGEVIGILGRGHSTMSYLVPSSEWITQVKEAQQQKKRKRTQFF